MVEEKQFKKSNSGFLYMKVTDDKYELPLAIAESAVELAFMVGTKPNIISSCIFHARERGARCQFVKVPLEDLEED